MVEKEDHAAKRNLVLAVLGATALAVSAAIITPYVVRKLSNTYYRSKSGTDDIDFDNMGPVVVNKDGETVEVD
jgi:hypothetical protein